ncbi:MAG: type II CAAX endopeptidase family protein [Anaerolineales bacterium]
MGTENVFNQKKKRIFRLYQHPWLAILAVIVITVFSILVSGIVIFGLLELPEDAPIIQFAQGFSYHILTAFVLVPLVLCLPKGKTSYSQYLEDIGLTKVKPFFRLALLALSCYLILAFFQATTSIVYRFFEGMPINGYFLRQVFDISGDLPPKSPSLLLSAPTMLEEVAFRGVILTTFLNKFSERKSILFSSLGFGLIHLLNLIMGRELIWVIGQVVWAFIIGLFYGYVFVRTRSLLPSMIVHYLGNAFIGSLTGYLQARASIEIQALYGVIFSLGIFPTTLMILWTRFFTSRWLPRGAYLIRKKPQSFDGQAHKNPIQAGVIKKNRS